MSTQCINTYLPYLYIHINTYICVHTQPTLVYGHTNTHTYTHSTYITTYLCVHLPKLTYACLNPYTHVHIYISMHTHTHILITFKISSLQKLLLVGEVHRTGTISVFILYPWVRCVMAKICVLILVLISIYIFFIYLIYFLGGVSCSWTV